MKTNAYFKIKKLQDKKKEREKRSAELAKNPEQTKQVKDMHKK